LFKLIAAFSAPEFKNWHCVTPDASYKILNQLKNALLSIFVSFAVRFSKVSNLLPGGGLKLNKVEHFETSSIS